MSQSLESRYCPRGCIEPVPVIDGRCSCVCGYEWKPRKSNVTRWSIDRTYVWKPAVEGALRE